MKARWLHASGLLASANVISIALNFLNTTQIAAKFGTDWQMDAFTVALSIPESLQYLLLFATVGILFAPLFIDQRIQFGEKSAWEMALSLLIWVTIVLGVVIPVVIFFLPWALPLLTPGFDPTSRDLTFQLSVILVPTLVYYATSGILIGICFAYNDFRTAAVNTVLFSLLQLGGFGIFVTFLDWGIYGLAATRLLTLVLLEGFLLWSVVRLRPVCSIHFQWNQSATRSLASLVPVFAFGAISGPIGLMINRMFASAVGSGSVAAWGYGQRLADIPHMVLGGALGLAAWPVLSNQVARGDLRAARKELGHSLLAIVVVMTPIALVLTVLREPVVSILFSRGHFEIESVEKVGLVLAGLAIGLPFRAIGGLLIRTLPAFKTRGAPVILSAGSTGLTIVFSMLLIGRFGLFGIALSQSLADVFVVLAGLVFYSYWLKVHPQELARRFCRAWLQGFKSLFPADFLGKPISKDDLHLPANIRFHWLPRTPTVSIATWMIRAPDSLTQWLTDEID